MKSHHQKVLAQTQQFVDNEQKRTGQLVPFSRLLKWLDENGRTYHSGIFRGFCQTNITGVTYKESE
jgi:hypothetical protein